MLQAVGVFEIHAPSSSALRLKSNSILDLYIELFIQEVENLLHSGLLKQYRKKEGNTNALKGNLMFSKHIQHNLIHQERFYVRYSNYDVEHILHLIIFKTIKHLKRINTNVSLKSRIGSLLLFFPEMPNISISESTFSRINYNRRNAHYRTAIQIAKLLLLQYHPDLKHGRNHVLALMFDMNKLWEQFVFVSLRKFVRAPNTIQAQSTKFFWKPERGYRSSITPDIIINKGKANCVVLDTKWKNLNGSKPSSDDLRQMFVYHEYYSAIKVALLYPGKELATRGRYLDPDNSQELHKECSIISIQVGSSLLEWQKSIHSRIYAWILEGQTALE